MDENELAQQMPVPQGYKLLIALPPKEEMTEGGIIKASETMHNEEIGSIVGRVIDMGKDAYQDEDRFPNGPYCERGDWIMMRAFTGTRFRIQGQEFRLINDETVEAVVADPTGITKV